MTAAARKVKTSPINVSLTTKERDLIDAAKARIGRFVRLCLWVDAAEAGPASEISDFPEGVGDLLELMLEDVNVLNATFELADQRCGEKRVPARDGFGRAGAK